jgi:hypothetical protein
MLKLGKPGLEHFEFDRGWTKSRFLTQEFAAGLQQRIGTLV